MMIGFTSKTSLRIPGLFCRNFKHCVVLFPVDKKGCYTLVQIATNGVRLVPVGPKELQTLRNHGWVFVDIDTDVTNAGREHCRCGITLLTCVGFAKRALRIKNRLIWTPDQLYRYLLRQKKLL